MNRRTLLTILTTGTVATAGCTSKIGLKKKKEYDRCSHSIVYIDSLPDSAKDEAIAAIEDDHYETEEELLLPEVIYINGSYILRRENGERVYYEMSVETDGEVTRLQGEEVLPESNAVWVRNATESDLTVDIRIEHEGDLLVERTVDIGANEDVKLNGNTEYKYGNYRAEVEVRNDEQFEATELTWEVHSLQAGIFIDSDGIRRQLSAHERINCKWNSDGELVSGPKVT